MFGAEKPRRGSERRAAMANSAAGVPWNREIRQEENSGRILGDWLRKMSK